MCQTLVPFWHPVTSLKLLYKKELQSVVASMDNLGFLPIIYSSAVPGEVLCASYFLTTAAQGTVLGVHSAALLLRLFAQSIYLHVCVCAMQNLMKHVGSHDNSNSQNTPLISVQIRLEFLYSINFELHKCCQVSHHYHQLVPGSLSALAIDEDFSLSRSQ